MALFLHLPHTRALAQPSLPIAAAAKLAADFAPGVDVSTLLAFAQYESGLNPNAVHDNTTGATLFLETSNAAVALAATLLAQGHSLDLGIMQVNSANFRRVGLTVATAFDPGQSVRAGAAILVEAYQRCRRDGQVAEQVALRCAASIYNTGNALAGILNGYQARVWRAAAQIVPAIQVAAGADVPSSSAPDDVVAPRPRAPPKPPAIVFEDALHPSPPEPEDESGLADALHLLDRKDTP